MDRQVTASLQPNDKTESSNTGKIKVACDIFLPNVFFLMTNLVHRKYNYPKKKILGPRTSRPPCSCLFYFDIKMSFNGDNDAFDFIQSAHRRTVSIHAFYGLMLFIFVVFAILHMLYCLYSSSGLVIILHCSKLALHVFCHSVAFRSASQHTISQQLSRITAPN